MAARKSGDRWNGLYHQDMTLECSSRWPMAVTGSLMANERHLCIVIWNYRAVEGPDHCERDRRQIGRVPRRGTTWQQDRCSCLQRVRLPETASGTPPPSPSRFLPRCRRTLSPFNSIIIFLLLFSSRTGSRFLSLFVHVNGGPTKTRGTSQPASWPVGHNAGMIY